jgi:probable HAF family extracellular repeat protein
MTLLPRLSLAILMSTALTAPAWAAGSLSEVGEIAPGYYWYDAPSVSGNGQFVTGFGVDGANFRSFLMTPDGLVDMGTFGTDSTLARAVSNNGVVAGDAFGALTSAFRWTQDAGYEDLGRLDMLGPIDTVYATSISSDGTRIVGASYRPSQSFFEAYVWVEGATGGAVGNEQMFGLGTLVPGRGSTAQGISGNGQWVAGGASLAGGQGRAVRWSLADYETASTTILDLGTLGGTESVAEDVSDDGRVVVGYATDVATFTRAFRWIEGSTGGAVSNPQMHDLGTLEGDESWAYALSSDGSVVVGEAHDADGITEAFRWTEGTGMIRVSEWLAANGVDTGGMRLVTARDISDDGNVVVGQMGPDISQDRAFIARVDVEQGSGLMDVAEYTNSLLANARMAQMGVDLTWLPMNGAHHRPLMAQGRVADDACLWSVSDLAGRDGSGMALAEAGACGVLGDGTVTAGLGIGGSTAWQDLPLGGNARLGGAYVVGEVDWQPDGTPLLLSLTGMLGGWEANVSRAYSNGAATDISTGSTAVGAGMVRARLDWQDALVLGNVSINPWVSGSIGRTDIGGYMEQGGAFPARFNSQQIVQSEVRLGVTAVAELTPQTTLSGTVEVAHRSGTAPAASGQVAGLFDFGLGGSNFGSTWARAGFDLDHQFTDTVSISGSLHAATQGQDASVSGSLGLKAAF